MNAAVQYDFPLDLVGILGAGKYIEGFATAGTSPLVFGKIVNHILRREVVTTSSPVALGAQLLTSVASPLGLIRRISVVIKGRSRIVSTGGGAWTLLRLSAEDLFLKPSYPRQCLLKLLCQCGNLGLLTANDLLQLLSLGLPGRLPLGSAGVLRLPVVRLLAELDFQATVFGILNNHASIIRTSQVCVQPQKLRDTDEP